jgi:ComF family protein
MPYVFCGEKRIHMPTIIAHRGKPGWREGLRRRLGAGLRTCAAKLSSACPLCGNEARGGDLCAGCRHSLMACDANANVGTSANAGASANADTDTDTDTGTVRCPRCAQKMASSRPLCHDCQAAPPAFDAACVAFDYAPPGDVLVRYLKDNSRHGLAPMLGRLVVSAWHAADCRCNADAVVVPIPASRRSMRRRGFNPAGEIARAIAWGLDLPLRYDCLARTREGPKQSSLSRLARQAATVDLFRANDCVAGREILLVDDVMTTGSTLDAAARALRAAGASRVTAVAVARTP